MGGWTTDLVRKGGFPWRYRIAGEARRKGPKKSVKDRGGRDWNSIAIASERFSFSRHRLGHGRTRKKKKKVKD